MNHQQHMELNTSQKCITSMKGTYVIKLFQLKILIYSTFRILWLLSLTTAIILTTILIIELIVKVQHSPIVIYLSDQALSVAEVKINECF